VAVNGQDAPGTDVPGKDGLLAEVGWRVEDAGLMGELGQLQASVTPSRQPNGLAPGRSMQAAFVEHDEFQRGYRAPGHTCSAVALLASEARRRTST
jgi:hypothetical protein